MTIHLDGGITTIPPLKGIDDLIKRDESILLQNINELHKLQEYFCAIQDSLDGTESAAWFGGALNAID